MLYTLMLIVLAEILVGLLLCFALQNSVNVKTKKNHCKLEFRNFTVSVSSPSKRSPCIVLCNWAVVAGAALYGP
jgi:hypothetical protein